MQEISLNVKYNLNEKQVDMEWDRGLSNRQFDCQAHLTMVNGPYLYSAIHVNLQFVGHFRCNKKSHAEFTQILSLDNEDGCQHRGSYPCLFFDDSPTQKLHYSGSIMHASWQQSSKRLSSCIRRMTTARLLSGLQLSLFTTKYNPGFRA